MSELTIQVADSKRACRSGERNTLDMHGMIHTGFSKGLDTFYRCLPYNERRVLRAAANPSRYHRLQKMRRRHRNGYALSGFDQHQCIFVHIPKCAGSAVATSLFDNLAGGHYTIRKYQLVFSRVEFENYFKFTIVRNPWDRLVSAYHYLQAGGANARDRRWAATHLRRYSEFGDFVRGWLSRRNIYRGIHFIPQFEFLRVAGHTPAVDFVGRFENIEEDFRVITQRLNIQAVLRPQKSRGDIRPYRCYYDDHTAALVADAYSKDIELFGYSF